MPKQRRTTDKPARAPAVRAALRRDPAAREIAGSWRILTGGGRGRDGERRTLLACSGGTDSAALVLALASHAQVPGSLVVGHVVHDLRPRSQTLPERDRAKNLASRVGLAFAEAEIRTRTTPGNAEANARSARYAALAGMARAHACAFVATAHQGDDLLETVLMRLLRGTGPRGLVGIHESRPLAPGITLIRPMLGVTRADAERLCTLAGWKPNDDPSNRDVTRLRARLRRDVLPVLRDLAPGVHERVRETSRCMAAAVSVLDAALLDHAGEEAAQVGVTAMTRARARAMPGALLAEVLRDRVRKAGGSLDRLPARTIARVCTVIQGPGTDPKVCRLPGVDVHVTARSVTLTPCTADARS